MPEGFLSRMLMKPPERLRKRRDFLAAARGRRASGTALSLQARRREESGTLVPRIGFTVTKKVGNAVVRNRVRRRLREAARQLAAHVAKPDHDYVIIGRRDALDAPFDQLLRELEAAFRHVHAERKTNRRADTAPHPHADGDHA